MENNGASSLPGMRPDKNKYRVFRPDYVLFAAENWAVETNIQLLTYIADNSSSARVKAQAKQLLAYFEALGITEGLKLNLWAKAKEVESKQKGPCTPRLPLFPTLTGKDGGK